MAQRPQKQPSAVYKDEVHNRSLGLSSLLWIVVGLLVAAMLVVFLYLSPLFDGFGQRVDPEPEAMVEPITANEPDIEFEFYEVLPEQKFQSIPEGVSIQDRGEDSLPKPSTDVVINQSTQADSSQPASISIVEEDTTYDEPSNPLTTNDPAQTGETAPSNRQSQYILQIKSYEKAEDADLKRAEVLMAGVDAIVVRQDTKDGYVYQVISTPMTQKEASTASVRLRNNGIDALLIEQRPSPR
ncbi:SPOR domain-containing protein [Moraxella canis]|uniref:SPOR domain-containing protein n=1 Tax=Moraxella canis TaxID=90239 RepID=UPI00066525B9|nr:SPOR domain-containing protein [Moraxella canis]